MQNVILILLIIGFILNLFLIIFIIKFNNSITINIKNLNEKFNLITRNLYEQNNNKIEQLKDYINYNIKSNLNININENFKYFMQELEKLNYIFGKIDKQTKQISDFTQIFNNSKIKGLIGEIQLEAIIKNILPKNLYVKNIKIKENYFIEFAIKIYQDKDNFIYLPIDSKFPLQELKNDKDLLNLKNKIKKMAQYISTKYINPPYTTNFAIMYIPLDSIFMEILQLNIIEEIFKKFKIIITSPSNLYAIISYLNLVNISFKMNNSTKEIINLIDKIKISLNEIHTINEKINKKLINLNTENKKLNNKINNLILLINENNFNQL